MYKNNRLNFFNMRWFQIQEHGATQINYKYFYNASVFTLLFNLEVSHLSYQTHK